MNQADRNLSRPERERRNRFFASAARYTAAAVSLPACVFVGYFMGRAMDTWLGTNFLYIVFLLGGVAAGFLPLFTMLKSDMGDK